MVVFHDPILVALSIVVAIFGSLMALLISSNYERKSALDGYAGCVACYGGVIMGSSFWSMHFIAMLALHLPAPIAYDYGLTVFSLALPILVTGLSLHIAGRQTFGEWSLPIGGILMGLAIAGMHYSGMSAVRGYAVTHDKNGVMLAIGVAIVASTVALWFVFHKRGVVETVVGALALGFAVAGMHYTAMYATSFAPLGRQMEPAAALIAQETLGYWIAGAVLLICLTNFAVVMRASRARGQPARLEAGRRPRVTR